MPRQHWLMKSEPFKYSFAQLQKDGRTAWDGVRNFEARNNLRSMKKGDLALFYHSNEGKEIVGIVRIDREAYPDPTAPGEDWSVVEVVPVTTLKAPVSLEVIKSDPELADIALLKRSRLSVVPVSKAHFDHLLTMAKTRLAARFTDAPAAKADKAATKADKAATKADKAATKAAPKVGKPAAKAAARPAAKIAAKPATKAGAAR
ncbi:MAG: EVE domain-containing protein [Polyangiaceae bacterium]